MLLIFVDRWDGGLAGQAMVPRYDRMLEGVSFSRKLLIYTEALVWESGGYLRLRIYFCYSSKFFLADHFGRCVVVLYHVNKFLLVIVHLSVLGHKAKGFLGNVCSSCDNYRTSVLFLDVQFYPCGQSGYIPS